MSSNLVQLYGQSLRRLTVVAAFVIHCVVLGIVSEAVAQPAAGPGGDAALPSDMAPVAQTGEGMAAPQASSGDMLFHMSTMFLMVFVIFYFLILRPQQAKLKAHKDLIGGLKKGDNVVTSGGIIGRVAGIDPGILVLEVAQNIKIKVEASHVVKRVDKDGAEKAAA